MHPSGKLSVRVWKIRFREKWNMKIDDPNEPQINWDQSTQVLVRKSTETKSKMAAVVAILVERRS
jgi:hypothetical protein